MPILENSKEEAKGILKEEIFWKDPTVDYSFYLTYFHSAAMLFYKYGRYFVPLFHSQRVNFYPGENLRYEKT